MHSINLNTSVKVLEITNYFSVYQRKVSASETLRKTNFIVKKLLSVLLFATEIMKNQ